MISDSTIALGVLLAFDEVRVLTLRVVLFSTADDFGNSKVQLGDFPTLDCHLKGLIQMVEHNGGPQTMGANGFLERLVSKFTGMTDMACKFALQPW